MHGLTLGERDVHASDLERTTECFVTSATREVMPIVSLRLDDGRIVEYPAGGGEITRKVAADSTESVRAYIVVPAGTAAQEFAFVVRSKDEQGETDRAESRFDVPGGQ